MNKAGVFQAGLLLAVIWLLVRPFGAYLERVFERKKTSLDPLLLPVERLIHRTLGVDPKSEMTWKRYSLAFALFGIGNVAFMYVALRWQTALPWFFPQQMTTPMTVDLAANTAVSFATTTTWQAYGGETTMSYFSQLLLAGQNFLAGAAGLAVGIAFIRGYVRERTDKLGNFWGDLIRALLWVLLPMSILGSLILVALGVPMIFLSYVQAHAMEGRTQIIAQGPVAALEFIKNLGTNGGGFFNVNAAHPFENPNGLTNFIELLAIIIVPAALTQTFGRMVRRPRDGWVIFWTMTALFIAGLIVCNLAESTIASRDLVGGNMEGKEVRFGVKRLGARGSRHLERRDRLLQFDARQFPAARFARAVGQHVVRRNYLWRARDRTHQHDLCRAHRAFHRRIDDRADAGTSRKEDRRPRDENHRVLHAG
jgi:K+-transporting ATPase ATPase A chain